MWFENCFVYIFLWLSFHCDLSYIPLKFNLDFSLYWNISFPAVTICEIFNAGKTWELSEKYVCLCVCACAKCSLNWFWWQEFSNRSINSDNVPFLFSTPRYYGMDRNSKLDDYLSDIAFFNGKCHSCSLCGKEFDCPTNFSDLSSKVMKTNKQTKSKITQIAQLLKSKSVNNIKEKKCSQFTFCLELVSIILRSNDK